MSPIALYARSSLLLVTLSLATLAHGGKDANGQDWGVLTATRQELGIAPPPAPSPCLAIDMLCNDCAGTQCTSCHYPFIVSNNKCVCPKGFTYVADQTTCIDMGVVDIGKKIYNNPTLKLGINQTQAGLQKLQNRFISVASKGVESFIAKETKDIAAVANAALAPLGLAIAPGPLPGAAGAPDMLPGAAPAGQPSMIRPTAEGYAGAPEGALIAEAPAALIPQQAPIVSLQQVGGTNAATASTAALQPIDALLSQAGSFLPGLFSNLGRRMLRAE